VRLLQLCGVFVQNETLPVVKGPVRNEATSVVSHLHTAQHPLNNHCCISSWNNSVTPAVTPVLPILPPPIVIAPPDAALDPQIQTVDPLSLLPQLAATSGCVEAPATAMTTETRERVPRPITGRGCRDQLLATTTADVTVSLCLCK